MENERILGIFKFGTRGHLNEFVRGCLYMNPLEHFVREETSAVRRDPDEGVSGWMQPAEIKVSVSMTRDGEFTPLRGIVGPIRCRNIDDLKVNVFCMYALRASAAEKLVDPRNFEFGDTFVVLKDGYEFLRRVRDGARNTGLKPESNLVEYMDESTYHGSMGVFRKSRVFSYQSEFRIALLPGTGSPYRFQIEDLSDIAIVGVLSELNRSLKVE